MRKLLLFLAFFFFSVSTVHAESEQKHYIQTNSIDYNGVSLPPVDNFPDQTICSFVVYKGIYPDSVDSYFLYPLVTDTTYTTCESLLSDTGTFLQRRGSGNSTYYLIPMSSAGYSANFNSANYGTKILSAQATDSHWSYLAGVNEQYFQMIKPESCGLELFPHIHAITDTSWDYYGTTYNWANSTNNNNSGYCSLGTTAQWDDVLTSNFSTIPELEYPVSSTIDVTEFNIASESSTLTASVSGSLTFEDVSDEDFCIYSFTNSGVHDQLNFGEVLAHVIIDNAVIIDNEWVIIGGGPKDLSKLPIKTNNIYYGIGTTRSWYNNITVPAVFGQPFNLQSRYECFYSVYDDEQNFSHYYSSGITNGTTVPGTPTHEDMADEYACTSDNPLALFVCNLLSSTKIWFINLFSVPTEAISEKLDSVNQLMRSKAPFSYFMVLTDTLFQQNNSSNDLVASDFRSFTFNLGTGTEYTINTPDFVISIFGILRTVFIVVLVTYLITYIITKARKLYNLY